MAGNTKFTLHIRGRDIDHGHVRVEDFIKQLTSFKNALSATDRLISETFQPIFVSLICGIRVPPLLK